MGMENAIYSVGDWVYITPSIPEILAQIVELRGPFGPKGERVYRLRIKTGLRWPTYVEIMEHYLILAE